jgi:FAD/FMN-containing dehydrogenase/Fe-S oxidoreductase
MISTQAPEATQEFISDLRTAVPEVHFDRMTRLLYSTDASIYQMIPVGVAYPRDGEEVAAAVEIAARHNVPILPRGGGSSLAGQAVGHAMVLDLSRHMDQILAVDPHTRTVRVQPGITLSQVNNALRQHNLMFGPDPASADRATIGGVLGNNASGAHSILYGMAADHICATDVILSSGDRVHFDSFEPDDWHIRSQHPGLEGTLYQALLEILSRYARPVATCYPRTLRNAAGYNLNKLAETGTPNLSVLMAGSEGTLGVITEATLNLVPVPKTKRLALVHFKTRKAALEAVPTLLESKPAAIEIIDKTLLDLTRDRLEYQHLLTFVRGDPEALLAVEYNADTHSELDHCIQRLNLQLNQLHHNEPVVIISDPAGQAKVWSVRKLGLGILMSMRGDTKPAAFIEDAAVPVEHLADYVEEISEAAREVGVEQVAIYGHASAGCLHIRPFVNLKTTQGMHQIRQLAKISTQLVIKYGGTTSGEHGEGFSRGEFSEKLFGTELTRAFREVKAAFDPHNLMNPGKVVDPPKMDDQNIMRYGPDYVTSNEPQQTVFSFSADGGFARAVEMCNGAGVCRQIDEGVMCPSFKATRDETHSTRGRANALRAAIMGQLGPKGLTSKQLYEVLDLCLSCQACKSECPSAVDMAKLKAEFLHTYYQEHGTPLRSRLFAHIADLNRLSQPFAPLFNALLASPGRWITRPLGVHPQRSLPKLASQPFSKWYAQHLRQTSTKKISDPTNPNPNATARDQSSQSRAYTAERTSVVFFHDTFMEHNDPHIGQAAIKILEAGGYEVIILGEKKCCGRPAVSKGLLDEAARLARHNLALLAPYAERAIPIVGCEPSCMAMLVDDYTDLVPGLQSQAVARMAMPIEKFLVREFNAGWLNLPLDNTPRRVLFHGHCQQKALFGTADTLAVLEMIPHCQVEQIESGCCGMAGSFGYEHEHYNLSIQLAEMSLAPAVRAAPPEAIICAAGTSCRQQIEDTTGRRALHPIEVLAEALNPAS